MSTLTSFHPFPRLPAELRLQIWEYCAVAEPQVVHLPGTLGSPSTSPKLLYVNRESHAVALATYCVRLVLSSNHVLAAWPPGLALPRRHLRLPLYRFRQVYRLAPHDQVVYPDRFRHPPTAGPRSIKKPGPEGTSVRKSVAVCRQEAQGFPLLSERWARINIGLSPAMVFWSFEDIPPPSSSSSATPGVGITTTTTVRTGNAGSYVRPHDDDDDTPSWTSRFVFVWDMIYGAYGAYQVQRRSDALPDRSQTQGDDVPSASQETLD